MKTSSLAGAALFAVLPSALPWAAHAAPDPAAYIPEDAGAVLVWKNPRATLSRAETLARSAGMAPPGAKPGWIASMLAEEQPWLSDVDLDQPVWAAIRFDEKKKGPTAMGAKGAEPEPVFVFAATLAGKGRRALDFFKKQGKARRTGKLLIATSGEALPAARKKAFAFPKSTNTLRGRSDVAAFVDLAALPLDRLEAGQASELRQSFAGLGGENAKLSLGLGLGAAGTSVFVQSHPEPGTEAAKTGAALPNTKAPLITGLPNQDYALLFGFQSDPDTVRFLQGYLGPLVEAATEEDPQIGKILRKLVARASEQEGRCSSSSVGVVLPGGLESLFFVGQSRCKSAEKALSFMTGLVPILNELIEVIEKREGEALGIRFAKMKSAGEVGGVKLSGLGLESVKKESALDEASPLAKVPLLFGSASEKVSILSWNAPEAVMQKLVASAKKGGAPTMAAFTAARGALVSPRMSEGYLRIGPVASGFLPPDLAPMRVLLSTLPPIAFAGKTHPDGSTLSQIWLPNQLAQLAAAGFQMMQAAQPGPPPRSEPAEEEEEDPGKPKKKI